MSRIGYDSYEQSWFFKAIPPFAILLVILGFCYVVFLIATPDIDGRHQEFRDYCASKGGEIFEQNNNFDCVLNGTHISYYGD